MSEQSGLNGGKASDWLRPYAPNWALSDVAGGVRLAITELRWTRQLRAVSAPRSVHTGGKSEAQLTKKQAVLLMHDTYIRRGNLQQILAGPETGRVPREKIVSLFIIPKCHLMIQC